MSLMMLISGISEKFGISSESRGHDVCTLLYACHAACVPYKSSQSGTTLVSVDSTLEPRASVGDQLIGRTLNNFLIRELDNFKSIRKTIIIAEFLWQN